MNSATLGDKFASYNQNSIYIYLKIFMYSFWHTAMEWMFVFHPPNSYVENRLPNVMVFGGI